MLERGERVTVVDVRKREAYAEGSIPGSVNFDVYDALLRVRQWSPFATADTPVRWLRSSCGGRDTRRSPWRED
jgi:rhodanese-related sulfurtransferase